MTYDETVALLGDSENAVRPGPGKFEGTTDERIAEALHDLCGDTANLDDEHGRVDEGGWYGLIGRFIVWEDDRGFFGYDHHDTEDEAREAFVEDVKSGLR